MNAGIRDHFPDRYIDEIDADPEDNYFTPVLRDVLRRIPSPSRTCDVGCGNGVFSAALKRWTGCGLVGVDGSRHALRRAEALGFDEVHQIEDFSSSTLPFADDAFDLVLNKDVLEHLLHPEHLVAEIARILRPGGHALVHVPNHFPLLGRLRLLFRNTIDPFDYFPDAERWNFPHVRFFTMGSLQGLFEKNDFDVVLDMSGWFFSPARLSRILPRILVDSLCRRRPDLWSEGYTVLFRRRT